MNPESALLDTAVRLYETGKTEEAESICRQIIRTQPAGTDVLQLLGVIAFRQRNYEEAEKFVLQAIAINKQAAEYHNDLGNIYMAQGKLELAEKCFQTALTLRPEYATAFASLGYLLAMQRKFQEASCVYRKALELAPDRPEFHRNFGNLLMEMAQPEQAIEHYREVLANIEGDKTGLLSDLLYVYDKLRKWVEVERALEEFHDIALDARAMLCKVRCFSNLGRYREAFQTSREYIEKFGEDYVILHNLMALYFNTGDGESGFEYYRKAIALCDKPDWRLNFGSVLLGQDAYLGVVGDSELTEIINDIRRSSEKLQTNTIFDNEPNPFRKIRIGYLSADFKTHPVGYFLSPVMINTVSSHCFNFCFNLERPKAEDDLVTKHFKSQAYKWEEVYECPDSHIEQLFLTNKIDIAFDMMCHSVNNRLCLHARRIAPVQISWIGFPSTTCVAAMDYVITDKNVDPPGSEKYYTERLMYMPDCFLCQTVKSCIPVEPPAFTRNGYITFACFHNLKKVTDKTLRMWRMILDRCENSRIKIIGRLPDGEEGREMLNERFRKVGLPMERVSISPMYNVMNDYFAAYNDVDIMLDTYPFSGATTTFDALGMGRPIITLVGTRHVTRVSYSLLKHVGLEGLAAFSEDEYVEKAVELANDHERLLKINTELPRRLEDSPLTNQQAFRKNFEKLIRDAWIKYCFDNRTGYHDYRADSQQELFEQVVNATVYIESKLESGEGIANALAAEYHRAQKAFCEKLKLVINDEEFIRGYEKLVRMIGHRLDEENLKLVISAIKRYLNALLQHNKENQ